MKSLEPIVRHPGSFVARTVLLCLMIGLMGVSAAHAADAAKTTTSPFPSLTLLAWLACYVTRKKDIGGWLLFYFINLYFGTLFGLAFLSGGASYNINDWDNAIHYILFVSTTVPAYILIVAQIALSFILWSFIRRKWKHILLLRKLLLAEACVNVSSVLVSAALWPDAIVLDIRAAVFSIGWYLYFKNSLRVELVFRPDRSWDWDEFQLMKGNAPKSSNPYKASPRQGPR